MKTLIFYIFFLGVFFTHPCHALSVQSRQILRLYGAVEKIKQNHSFASEDSKNLNSFSASDFFNDEDEDDESISIKKKIVFAYTTCFGMNPVIIKPFCCDVRKDIYNTHLFCISCSEFISLRVLKL